MSDQGKPDSFKDLHTQIFRSGEGKPRVQVPEKTVQLAKKLQGDKSSAAHEDPSSLNNPENRGDKIISPIYQPNLSPQLITSNGHDKKDSPNYQPKLSARPNFLAPQIITSNYHHDLSPQSLVKNTLEKTQFIKTKNQKRVWNYLSQYETVITNYANINRELDIEKTTLRKILDKFEKWGIITKEPYINGSARGMIISIKKGKISHDFITSNYHHDLSPQNNSSFRQKEEPKSLSIFDQLISLTEEDFAFHYPALAKEDFGPNQIQQILRALQTVGKTPDRLFQSLEYANWELEKGPIKDKNNEPVQRPKDFIFTALARWGYYRKPKGYVSPEEQAIKDDEDLKKSLMEARARAEAAAFTDWRKGLGKEDVAALRKKLERERGIEALGPEEYWLKEVWKKIEAEKAGTDP